jgi:phage baseplate assembly protein W
MAKPKKLELPQPREYRGVALPVTRLGGDYWSSKQLIDLVWSSIVLILGTPIGTRVMLPQFGSDITSLLFEPNDAVLSATVRRFITDAIGRWEPRVEIMSVDTEINESTLKVRMRLLVRNLGSRFDGTFTVYRNEAFRLVEQFWGPVS